MITNRFSVLFYLILLGFIASACGSDVEQVDNSETKEVDKLRIANTGSHPIENLIVKFPDDEIVFGDVAIGEITEYIEVPNGVFLYAAYRFKIDGKIIPQDVIDWMGESPLDGNSFTYVLDFDPTRTGMITGMTVGNYVRLVEIIIDE